MCIGLYIQKRSLIRLAAGRYIDRRISIQAFSSFPSYIYIYSCIYIYNKENRRPKHSASKVFFYIVRLYSQSPLLFFRRIQLPVRGKKELEKRIAFTRTLISIQMFLTNNVIRRLYMGVTHFGCWPNRPHKCCVPIVYLVSLFIYKRFPIYTYFLLYIYTVQSMKLVQNSHSANQLYNQYLILYIHNHLQNRPTSPDCITTHIHCKASYYIEVDFLTEIYSGDPLRSSNSIKPSYTCRAFRVYIHISKNIYISIYPKKKSFPQLVRICRAYIGSLFDGVQMPPIYMHTRICNIVFESQALSLYFLKAIIRLRIFPPPSL